MPSKGRARRILLALGAWNFGILAMLAYVLAGPDDTSREASGRAVTGGVAW
jgi:hypothetical protein